MRIAVPLSDVSRRQIARFRATIERACLTIDEIDETQWRVRAPDGRELLYFPLEDRWRNGSVWGRGTLTLIANLAKRSAS